MMVALVVRFVDALAQLRDAEHVRQSVSQVEKARPLVPVDQTRAPKSKTDPPA
jgi:hypothetical protein